jgi:hypothetical protein
MSGKSTYLRQVILLSIMGQVCDGCFYKILVLRIRDVYPGSRILIFAHPGSKTAMKDRGEKKNVVIPFFGAINFTKLKTIYF